MPGILYLDKPRGMTSHDVVNIVRRKTGERRVGHAGTLDPLATGLLIVLVGREFTKRQSEFLKQDKEYLVEGLLGVISDTYDIEGTLLRPPWADFGGRGRKNILDKKYESLYQEACDLARLRWDEVKVISKEKIEQVLTGFRGEISQVVPAFSAVKRKGKKLYELAREGQLDASSLPSRQVIIKELELISFTKDEENKTTSFKLRVSCSSGTYIRSLVHDIGEALGVGALVSSLRRTKIGSIDVRDASSLSAFR